MIAASRGDQPAYDGRFTRAVVNVLRELAAGDLDIDPAHKHVPLSTVAQAIHREVNRLAGGCSCPVDGCHADDPVSGRDYCSV